MDHNLDRRLLAIISGDVAEYTRMMAADEDQTIAALAAAREIVAAQVIAQHGRLVDFTGDNFLAEFGSAVHAANCALAIQHEIELEFADRPTAQRLAFRLGAHVGDVRTEGARLFGDGVNIASRLEGLAEPGGICCSRQFLDVVRSRVALSARPGGVRSLKGVPDPVEVYFASPDATENAGGEEVPARTTEHGAGAQIPVIAVLPLANLSAEPEEAMLADGITGDVIAGLSCDRRLSVIAYNSVVRFKGASASGTEISQALGAQYVVEGSVRKLGSRIRVAVALSDAETGREVWAGRFDRELDDLFEAMDEIVESIVVALASHLHLAEGERFRRRPPRMRDAWALAGQASQIFILNPTTSLEEPLQMAQRAVETDPDYAYAWAVLGFLTAFKFPLGLSEDHAADIDVSLVATSRALELDARDPAALTAHAIALQYAGRASDSLEYLQRSLRLNPSDTLTHCYYGRGMMFSGRPELAIEHFDRFFRLNPDDPAAHMAGMYHALALVFLERWKASEDVARRADAAAGGRNPWVLAILVIALEGHGRHTDALDVLARLRTLAPHWTRDFVEGFLKTSQEKEALMEPIAELLRAAWQ